MYVEPFLLATLVTTFVLAWQAVFGPQPALRRWISLAAMGFVFVGVFAVALTNRALPRLTTSEWRSVEEARVEGAYIAEGEGIYLWLMLPGESRPLYYVMPWDKQRAEELQEAMRRADKDRTGVLMRNPFEPSLERRKPVFHNAPPPVALPKVAPEGEPPVEFDA